MEHYTAADLPDEGWTTVTELLYIGPSPHGLISTDDVNQAVRLVKDGIAVNVPDSWAAVYVLTAQGVSFEQAELQVGWANGQNV